MSGVDAKCVMCGGYRQGPSRVCEAVGCRVGYRQHLQQGKRICVVCGKPVGQTLPGSLISCSSVDCQRQTLAVAQSSPRLCTICGILLTAPCQISGVCSEPFCQTQWTSGQAAQQAQRAIEKRLRLEESALTTHRQHACSAATPAGVFTEPIVIVVPANLRRLSSPPPERVAILRENLTRLATAVFAEAHDPQVAPPPPTLQTCGRENKEALEAEHADTNYDALVGQACGTCRGFCCFAGRNHAFLKHYDLRRTMQDKQLATVEALVDDFLSYLPEQSVEDSCLFHGPQGCGMPRRMRSDMCNTTLCPSLVNLFQKSNGRSLTQPYLFASTNVEDDLQTEPVVFHIGLSGPAS